jgi:hypothetical protein
LVSGYFSSINDTLRNRIALLNVDGSPDDSFTPSIDDFVWRMRVQTNTLVIGGGFHMIDGASRSGVARLNLPIVIPQGSLFAQHANGSILCLLNDPHFSPLPFRGGPAASSGWRIAGVNDFDSDSHSDFFWLNNDGRAAVWFMSGTNIQTSATITNWPGSNSPWKFVGSGNFNSDSSVDLLWQNGNGRLAVWLMNGTNFASVSFLNNGEPSAAGWRAVGVRDFNADGKADVVFQHTYGRIAVWTMNGTNFTSSAGVLNLPSDFANWRVKAVGDINSDGKPDLACQHLDGRLSIWSLNGMSFTGSTVVPNAPALPDWQIIGMK